MKNYNQLLPISRNTNEEYEAKLTFGQKIADKAASFGGSWTFIIIFVVVLLSWIFLNFVTIDF